MRSSLDHLIVTSVSAEASKKANELRLKMTCVGVPAVNCPQNFYSLFPSNVKLFFFLEEHI